MAGIHCLFSVSWRTCVLMKRLSCMIFFLTHLMYPQHLHHVTKMSPVLLLTTCVLIFSIFAVCKAFLHLFWENQLPHSSIPTVWVFCCWILSHQLQIKHSSSFLNYHPCDFCCNLNLRHALCVIRLPDESEGGSGLWTAWRHQWTIATMKYPTPKVTRCLTCHWAGPTCTTSSLTVSSITERLCKRQQIYRFFRTSV